MFTYGKKVTCNKCGESFILYADDGEIIDGASYITAMCPTCSYQIGCAIRPEDPDVTEYNIGGPNV